MGALLVGALLLGAVVSGAPPAPAARPSKASPAPGPAPSAADSAVRCLDSLARRLIARRDSAFRATAPLTASEKQRLRRYLNPEHLARARRLGLDPVRDRRAAAALRFQPPEDGGAVLVETGDYYIVDPSMGYAVPLLAPSAAHLLGHVGRRFQRRLLDAGLPPYRFVLTNLLRAGTDQAALQGANVNAAQGSSTHEYGASFDIFYEWFHYAAVHDTVAARAARRAGVSVQRLRRRLYPPYLRFGDRYARKIKAVLGRALIELQEEGKLLAIYERQEPTIHVTVARALEAPPDSTALSPADAPGR